MSGAKPVVVDVNETDHLLDVAKVERAITAKTKAILPVHLFGRMMDLAPLQTLARKHRLHLIEDAAQAHGAQLAGQKAGSVGEIGCFSFYPGKNLGCFGDGGMVTTNSVKLKDKIETLRNYGSLKKYHHPIQGFNSRLDTLQAAVLLVKLRHLDEYNQARYRAATQYNQALKGTGDLILPQTPSEKGSHCFHLYVVRTKRRDALLKHLNDAGIAAGIHYPVPIHLHGAYQNLGYKPGDFPVAEKLSNEVLSLPMYPELSEEQIAYVAGQIRKFF
jgi:dTDP-4-amino-4,6-dideoxygalactose transaminase